MISFSFILFSLPHTVCVLYLRYPTMLTLSSSLVLLLACSDVCLMCYHSPSPRSKRSNIPVSSTKCTYDKKTKKKGRFEISKMELCFNYPYLSIIIFTSKIVIILVKNRLIRDCTTRRRPYYGQCLVKLQ